MIRAILKVSEFDAGVQLALGEPVDPDIEVKVVFISIEIIQLDACRIAEESCRQQGEAHGWKYDWMTDIGLVIGIYDFVVKVDYDGIGCPRMWK